MNLKQKALIFDIDGTIVDSPLIKLPSLELTKQFKRLSNEYFLCAATGRSWSFAKDIFSFLQLQDPAIISAGTQICSPSTGEIIWQKNIPRESMHEVWQVISEYPNKNILINDYTEEEYLTGKYTYNNCEHIDDVYFFEISFVPFDEVGEILSKLNKINDIAIVKVVAQRPGTNDIHIINKNATKEHAIEELLHIIGIDKPKTIGVGDGHNDLHLFNGVGYKIAMGNAVQDLKDNADIVIGTIKDDGLTTYLSTL